MTPVRIQRSRAKGWRMPPNTVYVGRPTKWGNPFVIGKPSGVFDGKDGRPLGLRDQPEILIEEVDRDTSLDLYRSMVQGFLPPEMYPHGHEWMRRLKSETLNAHPMEAVEYLLSGKNLACFCPLDQPCHADVLLALANPTKREIA